MNTNSELLKEYFTEDGTRIAAGQVWEAHGQTRKVLGVYKDEVGYIVDRKIFGGWDLKDFLIVNRLHQDNPYPLNLCDLEEGKEYEMEGESVMKYKLTQGGLKFLGKHKPDGSWTISSYTKVYQASQLKFREYINPIPKAIEISGKTYDYQKVMERISELESKSES